ncbi:glucose N-acetyltransferase KNAG_0J00550 [Huiozyma naganishii CBS 8797]|uniref:Glycosyltransferase family 8 protein n=1 Tax=Huiozyma naganishii (strain ATCC MYA-139 / BCRC 22969 / CBS 8797 / KCTC 17520 / NBRC 10181 / NCYC 3082 / Yp74L-3) TaxID=1071383 RepID=J7RQQ4_HUIN7|nr:hypothetical protein KNAG_0J00550 [Kazachstania naganishii CBS 8797]CCK72138.1 hypothetical protein KNAG_0J00550 [Kazachstania naganishii CBS 8797]
MRIFSRRRAKWLLLFLFIVWIVVFSIRTIVQFQINEEINYYRRYFKEKKDGLQGVYNPLDIKQIPVDVIDALYARKLERVEKDTDKPIDWSKYAYVSYVAHPEYLCNTLIMFNALKNKYPTKAKLVLLLYDNGLEHEEQYLEEREKLVARIQEIDKDQVVIKYVERLTKPNDYTQWATSLTKLHVFNQTEFERVVYLDNDALLKGNMDELFFLPPYIAFASPLSYWHLRGKDMKHAYDEVKHEGHPTNVQSYTRKLLTRIKKDKMIYNHLPSLPYSLFLDTENVAKDIIDSSSNFHFIKWLTGHKSSELKFATDLMVIKPSTEMFQYITDYVLPTAMPTNSAYDMDVLNEEIYNLKRTIFEQFDLFRRLKSMFVPELLVLPFSRYGLVSGTIKEQEYYPIMENGILGYKDIDEAGNAVTKDVADCVAEAKYIHYSDYPMGKPWMYKEFAQFMCYVPDKVKEEQAKPLQQICDVWNSVYIPFFEDRNMCN